jgi:hypothetical protein
MGGGEHLRLKASLVFSGLLGAVILSLTASGDYGATLAVGGDNAAPGIEALLHGSVGGYVSHQPLIGLTTILSRLPLAGLASILGGSDLSIYKAGAFVCMLPLAFAAGWLVGSPGITPRERALRMVTVLIVLSSPVLRNTLLVGHPEDVAAAVLATAAVLAAMKGHARWAAVLLGLSIGAKEWAVVAVLPVILTVRGKRLEVSTISTGLVLVLVGLPWLADPGAVDRAIHAQTTAYLGPLSPLWPLAEPIRLIGGGYVKAARTIPWGLARSGALALQAAIALMFGGIWYVTVRRKGAACNPMCLLALVAAIRCICDTASLEYYWLALLIPVAAWECVEARLPVATLGVSTIIWALFHAMGHLSSTVVYLAATAFELALIIYLGREGTRPRNKAEELSLTPSIGLTISEGALT